MARYLVHIGEDFPEVSWVCEGSAGVWSDPVRGSLQQLAALAGSHPLDVLVPAEDVLLTEVNIASRQRRRLLQALPYSVEDQLAGDVDDYHVALGQTLGKDHYLVAAVSHAAMERWHSAFADAGLLPRSLIPENLAIPLEAGTATLIVDGDRALIRCSVSSSYAVKLSEANAFLQLEPDLTGLRLFDPEKRWTPGTGLQVQQVGLHSSVTVLLASSLDQSSPLNLLQGKYHRQGERAERAGRVWRWVALVAVLAFSLEVVGRWQDYQSLHQELDQLKQESVQILQKAFPEIGRVVEPRTQMDRELDRLRQANGIGGDGFLSLLRSIGPTVLAAPGLEIRTASYRGGDLTLEVHADSLAGIETVRQRIITAGKVQVTLESVTTLESGADARLRITGGGL